MTRDNTDADEAEVTADRDRPTKCDSLHDSVERDATDGEVGAPEARAACLLIGDPDAKFRHSPPDNEATERERGRLGDDREKKRDPKQEKSKSDNRTEHRIHRPVCTASTEQHTKEAGDKPERHRDSDCDFGRVARADCTSVCSGGLGDENEET